MGELRANTLSNEAGDGPAELTGQVAAKVWAEYSLISAIINDGFNASSLIDRGTGVCSVMMSSAFKNTSQCVLGSYGNSLPGGRGIMNNADLDTANDIRTCQMSTSNLAQYDRDGLHLVGFGDLA